MRGKVTHHRFQLLHHGITPAYAGKRKRNPNGMLQLKDHPRLCGEKLVTSGNSGMGIGSPPPMRGKAVCTRFFQLGDGITPAYAGKRPFRGAILPECQDHPRLCGEKLTSSKIYGINSGSPPPMRGKGNGSESRKTCSRITPAYAGKRSSR